MRLFRTCSINIKKSNKWSTLTYLRWGTVKLSRRWTGVRVRRYTTARNSCKIHAFLSFVLSSSPHWLLRDFGKSIVKQRILERCAARLLLLLLMILHHNRRSTASTLLRLLLLHRLLLLLLLRRWQRLRQCLRLQRYNWRRGCHSNGGTGWRRDGRTFRTVRRHHGIRGRWRNSNRSWRITRLPGIVRCYCRRGG